MTDELIIAEAICNVGRHLWERGMVASNEGNISARLADGTILCTPTGVSKGFMTPEGLAKLNMAGDVLNGVAASSEVMMHLEAYRLRADVNAVVHAHPPVATGWGIAGRSLPANILAETATIFKEVPIAPYATPGTAEVAASLRPYLPDHDAILLKNHGALTLADDIDEAYYRMEILENFAKTALVAVQLGGPQEIPTEKVTVLHEIRRRLGLERRG